MKRVTKKGGGVERSGGFGMDLGEPSGDHSGPSDDAHVPSLSHHRHQQRRQYPEAVIFFNNFTI